MDELADRIAFAVAREAMAACANSEALRIGFRAGGECFSGGGGEADLIGIVATMGNRKFRPEVCRMSFNLTASDFLGFLNESYTEYRADELSIRKAMVCCFFINHLTDHLVAAYGSSDPAKLHGKTTLNDYRAYLQAAQPCLAKIRDLCDYAEHSTLTRPSVTVQKTEQAESLELNPGTFLFFGFLGHSSHSRLVVTNKDGAVCGLHHYLHDAVEFCRYSIPTAKGTASCGRSHT